MTTFEDMKRIVFAVASAFIASLSINSLAQEYPVAGADEKTPSKAEYFTWMSHTNEGPGEEQTYAELDFFQWLYDTYGMELDIFAFDAGMLDGRHFYGSTARKRPPWHTAARSRSSSPARSSSTPTTGNWPPCHPRNIPAKGSASTMQ